MDTAADGDNAAPAPAAASASALAAVKTEDAEPRRPLLAESSEEESENEDAAYGAVGGLRVPAEYAMQADSDSEDDDIF